MAPDGHSRANDQIPALLQHHAGKGHPGMAGCIGDHQAGERPRGFATARNTGLDPRAN
ncbi:MAG: hypothetical protein ACK583_10455 [Cyanobacteriota bacterium]